MILGLQKHMDNYTSTTSLKKEEVTNRAEDTGDKALRQENEQLRAYILQYEQQIKDLESELKNLQ